MQFEGQEDLYWSKAYPEHYEQGEKEDSGEAHFTSPREYVVEDKPDPRRKWYVIKMVHYTTYDEGEEEWQADVAWGPYPSRGRAENVLNIQLRRCVELGIRAKFTIAEEI